MNKKARLTKNQNWKKENKINLINKFLKKSIRLSKFK